MSRKKADGFYADSLEMLLDTMCNILGGIIFITLTLAALTRDAATPAANERQTAQVQAELDAVTASNSAVEARIQSALQQLDSTPQTNRMRLPSISGTDKKEWDVIVRYHQIYPVYAAPPQGRASAVKNTRSLEWGNTLEPKIGQGQAPENSIEEMVQAFRDAGKTNYYFVFWVYDDSFDTFSRAKEIVFNLGMQYGWEPMPHDWRLTLKGRGQRILPQN